MSAALPAPALCTTTPQPVELAVVAFVKDERPGIASVIDPTTLAVLLIEDRYTADEVALSWPTGAPDTILSEAAPAAIRFEPIDGDGDGEGVAVIEALLVG